MMERGKVKKCWKMINKSEPFCWATIEFQDIFTFEALEPDFEVENQFEIRVIKTTEKHIRSIWTIFKKPLKIFKIFKTFDDKI